MFWASQTKIQKNKVGCLNDIHHLVEQSAEVNQAQLVVTQDGEMIVKMYYWSNYLTPHFKNVPGIKKFKHFHISTDKPGIFENFNLLSISTIGKLALKASVNFIVHRFNALITSWTPSQDSLPPIIILKGLDPKRQWYLFDNIREHCPNELCKNAVCPLQTVPRPTDNSAHNNIPLPSVTDTEPPSKRRCGICRETGHNSRSCNNK